MIHKFKAKRGYKFSGPCIVCGYTSSNETQHGHSCKILHNEMGTYCYECGKKYIYDPNPAYVHWR